MVIEVHQQVSASTGVRYVQKTLQAGVGLCQALLKPEGDYVGRGGGSGFTIIQTTEEPVGLLTTD